MKHITPLVFVICLLPLWACSGAQNNDDNTQDNNQTPKSTTDMTTDLSGDMSQDSTEDMPTTSGDFSALVINEVAAAGDPSDWVELYNAGDTALELSSLFLSDDPMTPKKSAFPSTANTIGAGQYLIIDINDDTVGFKIGGDEQLGIYDAAGVELALVDWDEGESSTGKSYGRFPNVTGDFKTLNTPTPGAENQDNTDADPVCPNNIKEGSEVCDGTDMDSQTCETQGFASGTLACKADCLGFDTSSCVAAMANVVINEVTSSGDDDIELYNQGNAEADLTGWYVADADYDPNDPQTTASQRFDIEAGTKIAPGGFLVIKKTEVNQRFGLGKEDTALLFNKENQVVDQIAYPKNDAMTSYCRIPDGTGTFQVCSVLTSGAANQP